MTSPSPLIQAIELKPVSFKLKQPFVTAIGQKTQTNNVQITLVLSDGTRGLAEASSSIAMPSQSQENTVRALKHLIPELRGKPILEYRNLVAICWPIQTLHPTAAAAMECAILDAYTRTQKEPLAAFFGGNTLAIETDLTFSVGDPKDLYRQARQALKKGFRRFKVKLEGTSPSLDVERLRAVHRAAPKALLLADGNQGFGLSQATEFAHELKRSEIPLVFFEQPFPRHDVRAMRLFRQRSHLPLLADESNHSAADAVRLFEAAAADGVNIKVAKSGLLAALDIIHIAQRFKKRLAIGCMEESKLGLAASVHLACGTGAFEWVDLDSVFLLDTPARRGGFLIKGSTFSVKGVGPGIGM
jgi:L-alanine-DL-glutamate epimerase-like enolase superfamily enzyme